MGDVTAEGLLEVGEFVAFPLVSVDAEVFGSDTEGAELLGQPNLRDWFASTGFHPGAGGEAVTVEATDDLAGEEAFFFEKDEDEADVEEEGRGGIVFLCTSGKCDGGGAGGLGPVTTGDVGDGEEGFPDVASAVV